MIKIYILRKKIKNKKKSKQTNKKLEFALEENDKVYK